MTFVQDLARFVAEFDRVNVSRIAMQRAQILLLDSLACAVAALKEPAPQHILDVVKDAGGTQQCTIFGRLYRTSLPYAAFSNSMLVRALDFNDFTGGVRINGHPSDNIAVILAAGEYAGRDGPETLSSIVLAYELYGRLFDTMAPDTLWDHVTLTGIVVSAVTAKLLGLDQIAISHAIAIGAAHAPTSTGLRDGNVSGAKTIANAMVAQQAVQAALFAAAGVTGPIGIFESRRGLGRTVFPSFAECDLAPAPLFRIMDSHIKAYPCVATGQALVAATQQLRQEHNFDLANISHIGAIMADVPVVRAHLDDRDRHYPDSRESADHSLRFLLAVTLRDGCFTAKQFEGERWLSKEMLATMSRIEFETSQDLAERAPDSFAASVMVKTTDRQVYKSEVLFAPGHARNPFTFEQAVEKFRACAEQVQDVAAQEAVIEAVKNIESAETVEKLMASLS